MKKMLIALTALAISTAAADVSGTWKLDVARSKYTGMPTPKELVVTYTPQGSGWRYEARGTSATGTPINSSFTFAKDGEEIKTTGFPLWDSMVLDNTSADRSTGKLLRAGKPVGTVTRTVAPDGKSMTIRGSVMGPDGRKATYLTHYDKQ